MIPLAIDSLGLPFAAVVALILLAMFGLSVAIGKLIAHGNREAEPVTVTITANVDPALAALAQVEASLADFAAHQERRANRAVLAQRERWGRSA